MSKRDRLCKQIASMRATQFSRQRQKSQSLATKIASVRWALARQSTRQMHIFTNALHEWNLLDETVRNSATLAEFKCKLLTSIKLVKNSLFRVLDICGITQLTMLHLEFSALNEHRFRHNFQCINPMCACNTGIEDNAHFFLQCPLFDTIRNDLLGKLSYLPKLDLSNIDPQALLYQPLYSSPTFNESGNQRILEASIEYIRATNRLK